MGAKSIPRPGQIMRRLGVFADVDLREGLCRRMDTTIWSGEWADPSMETSRKMGKEAWEDQRAGRTARAVALCKVCPALAACARQLKAFEDAGTPVHGVMAAREWGKDHPAPPPPRPVCEVCERELHKAPTTRPRPTLPEGHVYHYARGICARCYKRKWSREHRDKRWNRTRPTPTPTGEEA